MIRPRLRPTLLPWHRPFASSMLAACATMPGHECRLSLSAHACPSSSPAAHLSGDCYIAAAGILEKDEEGFFVVATEHEKLQSALNVMDFAKAILKQSKLVRGRGV